MSTLQPRPCGPEAWGQWQRDATRLFGRVLRAWGLPYVVLGGLGAWMMLMFPVLVLPYSLLLVWLHGAAHALLVAHAGRVAPASSWEVVRRDWRERREFYMNEMRRTGLLMLVVLGVGTALSTQDAPPALSVLPLWWGLGVAWLATSLLVFLTRPLGMMSLHLDLGKTMGLPFRMSLQLAARGWFKENMPSVVRVMPRMAFVPLLTLLLPIVVPLLELWWLAVLRCAYVDMFNQGRAVEERVPDTAAAWATA